MEAQTSVNAKVMSVGQGWRLLEVEDPAEATRPGTMMWEVSDGGVKFLPVSQAQKDIVQETFDNDPDGSEGLLFMSKEMLEAMENPDFPAGYEQYIDPNEPTEMDDKSLFGCGWHDETRNRSWNYSKSLFNQSLPFSGGITGQLNFDLPLSGTVTIAARYKIRKCGGVPTGFEFVDAVASGNATIAGTGDLSASASASAQYAKEWLLAEPELGEVSFTVGVIPVRLVFTLPIFAGVDLNAKISGQLSAHLNASASGTFTYTCTTHSCSGTSNFTDNFSFTGPNASVTVDLSAQAHARVMLRVGIYDEHIAYLEGGLKAYARAGVWGYIGNTCGDADGDGTNETVRALAADLLWGYKFAYGWGGWLLPDSLNYTGGSEYPIGWQDLLGTGGSTALQPMLTGPATAVQGTATAYAVKMRPCYPYTQGVNFSVAPGTWTGATSVTPPSGSAAVQGTLITTGNTTVIATANSDSFGRDLRMPYSRVINVTPVTPTSAALSATVLSSTSVRLNWTDGNTYKTGYEVQRRVSGVGSFAWLTTVSSTTATFTDSTAQAATAYDYKVRVLNAGTASPYSNVVTATTNATIPAAPSSLAATPQSATSVALSWADNSSNETNFEVQRRMLPSGAFGVLVTTAANVVSYTDTSAAGNTSYEYKVRALNSAGGSTFSNVATATTGQPLPAAPSGLAATYNATTRQFTLTWIDNSTNEQGFVPQFSYSGSAFSDLAPVGANVTTFASGANPPVGSYQFKVRAYNATGSSGYSNVVSLLVINPANGPG
ncbi:MAG TPA: fibronectin type III domain-containing protein, partial [Thermoanaerobaculia bacterium]|nr:fibronectin type III domain-containing protein [Thermoanaerobaculia bacterium]